MDCKKCKSTGRIVLRKKDFYCDNCFVANVNHKFRACIGKNKVLSANERVLICLSGGIGSTVLLDLVHNGISLDNHKKLRVKPIFFHVVESDNNHYEISQSVIQQCKKYNHDVYLVHISDYIKANETLSDANSIPPCDDDVNDQFHTMLNSMSTTASNDLFQKIKRNLFIKYAKQLQCKFVFTAETTITLAINLLSNLTIGRGSQVENDIGFSDTRNAQVKILRPMKDINKEELDYYINIKKLNPIYHNNLQDNSLQTVINNFVIDLQKNFQATVSTVCKTAEKIGVYDKYEKDKKCVICESDLGERRFKLTALEATNFSRIASFGQSQHLEFSDKNKKEYFKNLQNEESVNKSMFPLIFKHLCYGCSKNYSEIKPCQFPSLIQLQN